MELHVGSNPFPTDPNSLAVFWAAVGVDQAQNLGSLLCLSFSMVAGIPSMTHPLPFARLTTLSLCPVIGLASAVSLLPLFNGDNMRLLDGEIVLRIWPLARRVCPQWHVCSFWL